MGIMGYSLLWGSAGFISSAVFWGVPYYCNYGIIIVLYIPENPILMIEAPVLGRCTGERAGRLLLLNPQSSKSTVQQTLNCKTK